MLFDHLTVGSVASVLHQEIGTVVDADVPLMSAGLDSIAATELALTLATESGV